MNLLKKLTALFSILVLCTLIGCKAANTAVNSASKSSEKASSTNAKDVVTSVPTSSKEASAVSSGADSSLSSEESGFEYIPQWPEVPFHWSEYSSAQSSRRTSSKVSSAKSSKTSSATSSRVSSVASSKPNTNGKINSVENIINDMKLAHEGLPHGVPKSYSWSQNPRVGMGTTPREGYTATTAWGQVYEAAEGNPATNTRVQLRNMQMYYFSKSQRKWIKLQDSLSVSGNAYVENFQGNVNKSADQRDESSANGGGKSVKAGGGYNYHFWPTGGRADIDPTDIAVIYSTCQARLILDNPNKPDDRNTARYLLSIGGDYWLDQSANWNDLKTNGDWAIGRFKYVTNEWQAFNGWAGDENILRNNPPPMM